MLSRTLQIIDEDKKVRDLKKDSSHIDASATSSTSYESIHRTIHQNCLESSSSNDYTSLTEPSSDNSRSEFTQVEIQQQNRNKSLDTHIVFDPKFVITDKHLDAPIKRSLSVESGSSHGKDNLKGLIYQVVPFMKTFVILYIIANL